MSMRIVLAGALLFVLATSIASGDPYAEGPKESGWKPDNGLHVYCWGNDFDGDAIRNGVDYAFNNLEDETSMTKNKIPDCQSTTDVIWHTSNDNSIDGSYICQNFAGASRCEQAVARINPANMGSQDDRKQTACHETGHSVGLTHAADDCLSGNSSEQHYSSHHEGHINNDR